jgi:AraC-like DNA-binding protein
MLYETPAQDKLNRNAKTIERMRQQQIGCRNVAIELGVSTVTLLTWYKKRFKVAWGHGEPTGRKRTVPDDRIIAAADKNLRLIDAAAEVGLSQPGYVHAFRRLTQMNWRAYKNRRKPKIKDVRASIRREIEGATPAQRLRVMLRLRKQGLTLGDIGSIFNLTESAICRIIQRGSKPRR